MTYILRFGLNIAFKVYIKHIYIKINLSFKLAAQLVTNFYIMFPKFSSVICRLKVRNDYQEIRNSIGYRCQLIFLVCGISHWDVEGKDTVNTSVLDGVHNGFLKLLLFFKIME
jgi:hypothetical protein